MRRTRIGPFWALVSALAVLFTAAPASAQEPALDWDNYEKVVLAQGANTTGGPLDLAVMPDGRILHTNRNGMLRLTDPMSGITKVANAFSVYVGPEEGLQTVSLDPDFETNNWVYIYYSPQWQLATNGTPTNAIPAGMSGNDPDGIPYPTQQPAGNAPTTLPAGQTEAYWQQWRGYNQLSRFKWNEATDSLDMASEQKIIKIHAQRGQCCHLGTDVAWDSQGNLYLSTGDNVPAGGLGGGGYAVINDDTPGANPGMDARRSSGNTNDLRGKILRIKVLDSPTGEGLGQSYTVPSGNLRDYVAANYPSLVTPDFNAKFRPEIYVMGLRNPFRMVIDPETDLLSWGEYGPDAGNPSSTRGPMGKVEWTVTSKPQNAGWPFCLADNSMTDDPANTGDGPFGHAYSDWDHVNLVVKSWFNCQALVNDSKWNTGLTNLPPATAPTAYYGDRLTDQPRPEFINFRTAGRGFQSPMAGPRYHFDAANPSTSKWPAYWDDKWFFFEFDNRYIAAMTTVPGGSDGVQQLTTMENVLPNTELTARGLRQWINVIDMEWGPDGALYTIEYGNGGNNDTGLVRTAYALGNKAPIARFTANPASSSTAPLLVNFNASGSSDPDGDPLTYDWDFDGDGTFEGTGVSPSHTYNALGSYTARLRVTDPDGKFSLMTMQISVGNQAPTITVNAPPNGGFFSWGDAFLFNVTASDPEDGPTPVCTRMNRTWSLGHGAHSHGISTGTGCTGVISTTADGGHPENEDTYGVLEFSYTDAGANGLPAAGDTKTVILQQRLQQAEFADDRSGVTTGDDAAARGGSFIGSFDAGDFLAYDPVNFLNITGVRTTARGTGTLSLRWNSAAAAPFATINVAAPGSAWATTTTALSGLPAGTGKLYVTSTGGVEVDAFEFLGDGVSDKTPPTVTAALNPASPNGQNGWYTSNVTLTLTATDNGTVASRQYSLNGGTTWLNTNAAGQATINTQGVNSILFRATDTGGNISAIGGPLTVRLDSVAPLTTSATSPAAPDASGWFTTKPTVTLTRTDATSGVALTEYRIDGGSWTTYSAPFVVNDGQHLVEYRSTDTAGNLEAIKSFSLKVDSVAPSISCSVSPNTLWPPNHKLVAIAATVSISDGTSGTDGYVLSAATSDEPDSGTGPEDVANDIVDWTTGTVDLAGSLRAERADGSDGRVYTLLYTAKDVAGNSAPCIAQVTVPKSKPK